MLLGPTEPLDDGIEHEQLDPISVRFGEILEGKAGAEVALLPDGGRQFASAQHRRTASRKREREGHGLGLRWGFVERGREAPPTDVDGERVDEARREARPIGTVRATRRNWRGVSPALAVSPCATSIARVSSSLPAQ